MAAVVKIDFMIGGVDAVRRAVQSVSQATDMAIRMSAQNRTRAARETTGEAKRAADQEKRIARETVAEVRRINRDKASDEKRQVKEVLDVVRAANREKMADERKLARESERNSNRERLRVETIARERRRALVGIVGGGVSGGVEGVRTLGRGVGAVVRGGVGLATSLASGAGVEFGLGRAIRGRAELERRSIDLSNSGYQEQGQGIQTERVDPKAIMAQAREIGLANAIDPAQVVEGMQKFTGITGDLATARATLPGMAKIAQATGANLADVIATAGEISKTMGDAPTTEEGAAKRASELYEVMKGVAGGGKLGSVELADTAKHGGRFAAAANQFEGGPGENVIKAAALAQWARGGGGAWNAASAAGAVSGMVNTFKTPARQRAFEDAGVKIMGAGGKIRDPLAIMSEAIDKTGGDMKKLQPMFANVVGARAMQGLANKYLEGSKGGTDEKSKAAGRAALKAEIDRMTSKATMSEKEVTDSSAARMGSLESKAQIFQQRVDQIAGDLADKLMPAMLKFVPVAEKGADVLAKFVDAVAPNADTLAKALVDLAPHAVSAASALAKLVTFAVDHPALAGAGVVGGMAVKGVIGAGIGAAGSAITSGVANGAAGTALAAGGSKMLAAGRGAVTLGTVGAGTAGAVLAAGAAGFGAGYLMTDAFEGKSKTERDSTNAAISESMGITQKLWTGQASPDDVKRAQMVLGQLDAASQPTMVGKVDAFLGDNRAEKAAGSASELREALAAMKLDPNSQVTIANPDALAGPIVAAIGAAGLQQPKVQAP